MIAIVGGGLTGLALAHELRKRDVPHVLVEAADRPGGVIRSARVQGHLLEWGPQRARLTGPFEALVDELGLREQLTLAPGDLPLFVYRAGKLRRVPFSATGFLRTDLLSWRGKLRLAAEPLSAGARADESVASYFTRKIGREAYESLVGPLYGGLYASDPADMIVGLSLGHVLREFGLEGSLLLPLLRRGGRIEPPAACSFSEGLETLPRALYRHNRERVRLSTPARALQRRGERWTVVLDDEELAADDVVLTLPAPAAARLLEGVDVEAAGRIAGLTYNPLVVVHLHARTALRGLGYQVSFAEDLVTRGVTFNDSLFDRDGVYTVYLGGAKRPEVVDWTDERLGETALDEFRRATGHVGRVLAIERERMPAWDRSWRAMQGLRLPEGLHIAANWESRPGIPGRLVQARMLAGRLSG